MKANSQVEVKESMIIETEVIAELTEKESLIARLGEEVRVQLLRRVKLTLKQKSLFKSLWRGVCYMRVLKNT